MRALQSIEQRVALYCQGRMAEAQAVYRSISARDLRQFDAHMLGGAACLLEAIGLPELVTNSLDRYEALALQLATDRLLLA